MIKPQGGIGRHTETLARGFANRGHAVTVAGFGLHRAPRMEHEWGISLNLNFAPGSHFSFGGLRGAMAVRQFLRRRGGEFDVVEMTNFWGPGAFAPPLPIPYLVRLSSPTVEVVPKIDYETRVWNWLEARTVRHADLVLCNSAAAWEACRHHYALADMPRCLLPYGVADVPPDDLSPSPVNLQILVIGRAEFRKGTDILIRALAAVMPQHQNLRFVSIGSDLDGFTRKFPAVRDLWCQLRETCGERIQTLGRVDDFEKVKALRVSHWLLVPSRFESFGQVVIEAMRSGTPVVASNGGVSLKCAGADRTTSFMGIPQTRKSWRRHWRNCAIVGRRTQFRFARRRARPTIPAIVKNNLSRRHSKPTARRSAERRGIRALPFTEITRAVSPSRNWRNLSGQCQYRVRMFGHESEDLFHTSNARAGMARLHRARIVHLETAQAPPAMAAAMAIHPASVWMEVECEKSGRSVQLFLDLMDRSDVFVEKALEECDVYLKRGFHEPDVTRVRSAATILPFGMNFACRAGHWIDHLRMSATHARRFPSFRPKQAMAWRQSMRKLVDLQSLATTKRLEHAPDQPGRFIIHFQTRLWTHTETTPDSAEEVNEERIRLIRDLRRAFGRYFEGGLVPTAMARRIAPDLITPMPTFRSSYIQYSKPLRIGIYTRGLHHSTGFKMAEYLASSKIVLASGIRNTDAVPLRAGFDYLPFSTADQCVSQCGAILKHPEQFEELRRNAWAHYQAEVDPAQRMLNAVDRAVSSFSDIS